MARHPNAQYNLATADSLSVKLAGRARRLMYQKFLEELSPGINDSILDVGVTSDQSYESSNYLEAWYPQKDSIVAAGIDDASHLEQLFPGVQFVRANGCRLPFRSNTFDFVHSSAVLEHVGSSENQSAFIRELCRVAKKGVFLTTPNRWYPIEFHTILPFLHWLPRHFHRQLLRILGYHFFAEEANLNLVGKSDLVKLCKILPENCNWRLGSIWFLGGPSNLLAIIRKYPP